MYQANGLQCFFCLLDAQINRMRTIIAALPPAHRCHSLGCAAPRGASREPDLGQDRSLSAHFPPSAATPCLGFASEKSNAVHSSN